MRHGASRLLTECIPLRAGERLAIFFDTATASFAKLVEAEAKHLKLNVLSIAVSAADYARLKDPEQLPKQQEQAIMSSRAVIIALGSSHGSLAYRRRLLDQAVDDSRFVALLPNATPELLAYGVAIDYAPVERKCEELAAALLSGDHAEVHTGDHKSKWGRQTLHVFLGRHERLPITSTGILQRGTWGNVPGGETFIAPLEDKTFGRYVLNGAYKNCVLDPNDPICLSFESGELVQVEGSPEVTKPFLDLLQWDPGSGKRSGLHLAELGIGVNEGLNVLTGNALFDEKLSGTIHIAVGENLMYGGRLKSYLHEDLVAREPDLFIDGRPILINGNYVLDPSHWYDSVQMPEIRDPQLRKNARVAKSGHHAYCKDGALRVHRDVGLQRICTYTVGDETVRELLGKLWPIIPDPPETINLPGLERRWNPEGGSDKSGELHGLLSILRKHHLIEFLAGIDEN